MRDSPTQSDAVAALEKDYGYKDDHFTFIQQHLRRICLKCMQQPSSLCLFEGGADKLVRASSTDKAGLLYTSTKRDKNCDVLRSYVKHLLYALDFDASPQLIEKDTVFIPAGWDSIEKIQIDFNSQSLTRDEGSVSSPHEGFPVRHWAFALISPSLRFRSELPYEDVIRIPPSVVRQSKTNYEAEVLAEDDQAFLDRQLKQIDKTPAQAGTAQIVGTSPSYSSPSKSPPAVGTYSSVPARLPSDRTTHHVLIGIYRRRRSLHTSPLGHPTIGELHAAQDARIESPHHTHKSRGGSCRSSCRWHSIAEGRAERAQGALRVLQQPHQQGPTSRQAQVLSRLHHILLASSLHVLTLAKGGREVHQPTHRQTGSVKTREHNDERDEKGCLVKMKPQYQTQ